MPTLRPSVRSRSTTTTPPKLLPCSKSIVAPTSWLSLGTIPAGAGRGMGSEAWRSARSQGRCCRLDRAYPVRRDAQLCAACHGESSGLLRTLRNEYRNPRAQPPSSGASRVALQAGAREAIPSSKPAREGEVKTDEKPERRLWAAFSLWRTNHERHNERRYISRSRVFLARSGP